VKIPLHFMQKSLVYTWQICELADQNFSNGVLVVSRISVGLNRFFACPKSQNPCKHSLFNYVKTTMLSPYLFLILMILLFPLTRLIVGTVVGTVATIVPLVIAAFPFIARLVESSLREVNPNLIETAKSMGASPFQIIIKVMIPESIPSLLSNLTIAVTTVLGYSSMSGIIGGGGLGKIAINYGYYRYKYLVMVLAVKLNLYF